MAWFKKKKPAEEPAELNATEQAASDFVTFEGLEEVPRDPRDWPKGKMSYLTYGNEGDDAYGEGATGKIGPAEVAHHADGSVTVGGKKVDDPSKYKGKPITGGIIEQLTQNSERNKEARAREAEEREQREGG